MFIFLDALSQQAPNSPIIFGMFSLLHTEHLELFLALEEKPSYVLFCHCEFFA